MWWYLRAEDRGRKGSREGGDSHLVYSVFISTGGQRKRERDQSRFWLQHENKDKKYFHLFILQLMEFNLQTESISPPDPPTTHLQSKHWTHVSPLFLYPQRSWETELQLQQHCTADTLQLQHWHIQTAVQWFQWATLQKDLLVHRAVGVRTLILGFFNCLFPFI